MTDFRSYDLDTIYEILEKIDVLRIAPRLTVERRVQHDGAVKWCVNNQGFVLNTDGEFEDEPRPSSREDDFIARTRFDFETAYRLAMEQIYSAPEEQRRLFYTYLHEIPPRREP
jgi:hypothetical protein